MSNDQDSGLFDKIVETVKSHTDSEYIQIENDAILLLPGLEINTAQRKVYCNQKEVYLTPKEFDLLYLLAANKGQTLTYDQIYRKVWHEDSFGNVSNNIAYHVCNLRQKVCKTIPHGSISIKCVNKFGYSLEINT